MAFTLFSLHCRLSFSRCLLRLLLCCRSHIACQLAVEQIHTISTRVLTAVQEAALRLFKCQCCHIRSIVRTLLLLSKMRQKRRQRRQRKRERRRRYEKNGREHTQDTNKYPE